jgi:PAS domain S-box-containing protein
VVANSYDNLYKEMLDAVGEAVIATDLEGNIQYWNRGAETNYQWRCDEVLGKNITDVTPSNATRQQVAEIMKARSEGVAWKGEFEVQRKDGTSFMADIKDSPVCDERGEIIGIIGVSRDITKRNKVEKDLLASEQKYRNLFTQILDGYALHEIILNKNGDPVNYRFTDINPAFEKTTGLTRAIIGKTIREVLPGIENSWIETYGRVAKTGEPIRFTNFAKDLNKWFEILAFRHQENGFATIFQDISERVKTENDLRESEQNLALAQGVAHIGSWKFNLKSKELYWSDELFRIYGLKPGEQIASLDLAMESIHPDDKKHAEITFNTAIETGQPYQIEYRIIHPTGEERIIYGIGEINKDDPDNIYGTGQDITKRKKREQELSFQAEILSQVSDAIIVTNNDAEYSARYWNHGAEKIYGWAADEVLGKSSHFLTTQFNEQDRDSALKTINAGGQFEGEVTQLKKDGTRFPVETRLISLRNDQADITGWIAVNRDISERKQVDAKIRQQALLLEQVHNGIITIDFDNKILSWNKHAEVLYQWSAEEVIGKNIVELLSPEELKGVVVENLDNLYEDGYWEGEFEVRRKDSTTIPTHMINTHLKDADGINIGFIGISQDITDRKRAEGEMQRRIREIEHMNKMYMGREGKMIELKREINTLLAELNRSPKYAAPGQVDQLRE